MSRNGLLEDASTSMCIGAGDDIVRESRMQTHAEIVQFRGLAGERPSELAASRGSAATRVRSS